MYSSQSSMGLLHSPAARTVKLPIHEKKYYFMHLLHKLLFINK
jgi:hypothetical protein